MNKEEQQAKADAENENKKLIEERKEYQAKHRHWTKY